jgi:hypothetical protein
VVGEVILKECPRRGVERLGNEQERDVVRTERQLARNAPLTFPLEAVFGRAVFAGVINKRREPLERVGRVDAASELLAHERLEGVRRRPPLSTYQTRAPPRPTRKSCRKPARRRRAA